MSKSPGIVFLNNHVAERTSYFCLARKLIWPLWSSHIFTQWGWLILFSPDHFPGQRKNGESPLNYREGRTYFLFPPFIAAEAQHHEESRLIYGPLESTLLDQGFPDEHELDACNLLHTGTPLCRLHLLLCIPRRVIRSDILLLHSRTTFSEDFHVSLLQQPGPHIYGWQHHSCP